MPPGPDLAPLGLNMSTALEAAARDQLDYAVSVTRAHVVEGRTIAETAAALGITRARVERCLRFVRDHLARSLAETSATPSRNARPHSQR